MIFLSCTDDPWACDSMLQDLSLSCSNGLCNLRLYTADGPCLEQLVSKVVKFTQLLGHNTIFAVSQLSSLSLVTNFFYCTIMLM
jgi:hypothetical protein